MIPFSVFMSFTFLYLNFQSIPRCLLVLLDIPFSMVGAMRHLDVRGYHLSVAI